MEGPACHINNIDNGHLATASAIFTKHGKKNDEKGVTSASTVIESNGMKEKKADPVTALTASKKPTPRRAMILTGLPTPTLPPRPIFPPELERYQVQGHGIDGLPQYDSRMQIYLASLRRDYEKQLKDYDHLKTLLQEDTYYTAAEVDVLDALDEDPFTLDSFENLMRIHASKGKDFILARVTTQDPNDEMKHYHSYYGAHQINKVLFRTQPEKGLLHRMRARNPLNNMLVVGDVHYYIISAQDVNAIKSHPTVHSSSSSISSHSSRMSRCSKLAAQAISSQSASARSSPILRNDVSLLSRSSEFESPLSIIPAMMAISIKKADEEDGIYEESVAGSSLETTTAAFGSSGNSSVQDGSRYHSRRRGSGSSTESASSSVLSTPTFLQSGFQPGKPSRLRRTIDSDVREIYSNTSTRYNNPESVRAVDPASPFSETTERLPSHSHQQAQSPLFQSLMGGSRIQSRSNTMTSVSSDKCSLSSSSCMSNHRRYSIATDTSTDSANQKNPNGNSNINISDIECNTEGSIGGGDEKIEGATYKFRYLASDDDFLLRSAVRQTFKANALESWDAILFTVSNNAPQEDMSHGGDHAPMSLRQQQRISNPPLQPRTSSRERTLLTQDQQGEGESSLETSTPGRSATELIQNDSARTLLGTGEAVPNNVEPDNSSILNGNHTRAAHSPAWPTIAYSETIHALRHDILPQDPIPENQKLYQYQQQPQQQAIYNQHLRKRNVKKRNSSSRKSSGGGGLAIVQKDDKLRVEFTAFNQTFYLHLEPNLDLVHPKLDLMGQKDLESLEDIKPFKGIVLQDETLSMQKWKRAMDYTPTAAGGPKTVEQILYEEGVVGWARMMVEHDESDGSLMLRGAFTVDGDTYHITSRQHYHVQKRSDDYTPSSSSSSRPFSQLIIYRNSDIFKPRSGFSKREDQETICGAHQIIDRKKKSRAKTQHGYYNPPNLTTSIHLGGSFNIFNFGSMLRKRQDGGVGENLTIKVAGPNPAPTGCPTTRMVNYMGVAADCTYVRSYGGLENARKQIFADFNTASGIYESTFNVALGIISLEIESMACPTTPVEGKQWNQECSSEYTINDRLSDFSYWRGQGGRSQDGAGLWHLMTKCNTGPVIGIAWTKALCQMSAQSQSTDTGQTQFTAGAGVSSISPNEWHVVAHEVAHGFGANHDCTASSCASAQTIEAAACCPLSPSTCDAKDHFIMNPSEQNPTTLFSPCSIFAICNTISSTSGSCLKPPETKMAHVFEPNVCGNGIREAGEQCDCGTPEECADDPCCDGATCQFKGTAVCDDMNDDCCLNCQLAPQGTICRSAISNCDYAETCTGNSTTCPEDNRVTDLTPCEIVSGNKTIGRGQCAHGICTSRDFQCAQQQRQGITKQCEAMTSGCEMLCNDPNGSLDLCMKIPSVFFVDGTPCGNSGTGTCDSGKCILSGGWAANHLEILIPVVCLVALAAAGGVAIWVIRVRRKRRILKEKLAASSVIYSTGTTETNPSMQACESSSAAAAGSKYNDDSLPKEKDTRSTADAPRWMITSDRRSSQVMTRRTDQVAISRRASFSTQNMLRISERDVVPVTLPGIMPPSPSSTHVQEQPRFQQQQYDEMMAGSHPNYSGEYDEHDDYERLSPQEHNIESFQQPQRQLDHRQHQQQQQQYQHRHCQQQGEQY
ncbi:hypothetical protein BG011_009578 [Mortierella polycephala]|uniref:Disintegrin and metalloproteinase domain-containing protein B n=1 Tax=Mortierella polycephala TaxID=41804 RepID=A0A9P6PKY8_9FUNG|nr:hypothetical protein BG011_009578 [Mortierella polycephala]